MTEPTIQDNTSDETNWSDKGSFHVNPKIQPHQFTPQSIQRKKQPFVKQDKNAIPSVTTATTATTLSSSSEPIQGLMFATPLTSMSTEFNDFKLIKPTKAIKTLPLGESTSTNRLNVPNTPQSLQRGDSLTKSQSTLTGKPFGTYHKHPTNQDENSVGLASSLSVTPTTPKGKTTEPSLNISASFRKSTLDKPPQILFKIDPHGTQSLPPPKSKGVTHSKLAAPPSVNHVLEPIPSFDKMPAIIDDGKKPPFSYATLIGMAILRSPERKLTLSLIYQWINDTYEYYRTSTAGWQNSIRHNLSLNKAFQKQERPKGDPGKGNYWIIVPGFEYQFMKSRSGKRTSQQKNIALMGKKLAESKF
ncbi:hypothetical protein NADFUDRAFT_69281 [Nadsonia fulvescens var. elongata DSM 6958]|uniref:Fork-head domain-containing protein n=1 Tax=Nadsonia fulvescens var. elongata DSM 6958 TaxID=857566 RepID=A0A1E3PPX2_9ASCO|nr:hypothetical protein NADFUDRAFT_69281 [Nadsonia fulvescens var. elongata DSM 6958]